MISFREIGTIDKWETNYCLPAVASKPSINLNQFFPFLCNWLLCSVSNANLREYLMWIMVQFIYPSIP